jgi:hypothetical protein
LIEKEWLLEWTLLSDLPPFYCRYNLLHIALLFLQFVLYSFPPLLRLIIDGIGSFATTVIGEKVVVPQWKHYYLICHPSTAVTVFSAYSIVDPPIFVPYSLPPLLKIIYDGIESFTTSVKG